MAKRFDGQVAWVTGGGTGIGKAIAAELARQGAIAVVSGRRQDRLDAAVAELEAGGATAAGIVCDVNDDASVAHAVSEIVARFGRLDVVVANAGFSVGGRVTRLTVADWERQFSTNLFGVVRTVNHALPHLQEVGGRIGLIGSVAQYLPVPGAGAYAASKAAVHAYGQTLSAELTGSGVSCTTIHPGFIESEIAKVDNEGTFDPNREDTRPAALMWKPDAAAVPMARALAWRRREVVITGHGKLAAFLGRHLPGLTALLMSQGAKQRRG